MPFISIMTNNDMTTKVKLTVSVKLLYVVTIGTLDRYTICCGYSI